MNGIDLLALLFALVLTAAVYGAYPYLSAKVREKPVTQKIYKKQVVISCVICWLIFTVLNIALGGTSGEIAPAFIWGTIFYHWGLKILKRRKMLVDHVPTKKEEKISGANDIGSTVKLVTQNFTAIYCILSDHNEVALWKEEHKLFAAALIDATTYLKRGVLSAKDIAKAVFNGRNGIITSFPVRRIFDPLKFTATDELAHVIMQLTIVLYNVDSSLDSTFLVESIVSEKELVTHTACAIIAEGEYGTIYQNLQEFVSSTLNYADFKNIVFSYDALCEKGESI